MPRRKRPRPTYSARKKLFEARFGKPKGSKRMARKRLREALEGMDFKTQKLSEVVSNPSRYSAKHAMVKKTTVTKVPGQYKTVLKRDYYRGGTYPEQQWVEGHTVVTTEPVRQILVKIRKHHRRAQRRGKGGGSREDHKTGTMAAKKSKVRAAKQSARISGTKGGRPGREKRKQKKKNK